MLSIKLSSVMVDDQDKALAFYTEKLGFETHLDIPMGEEFRWLTVIEPGRADVELLLEPLGFPPSATFQQALFEANIPATAFETNDIQAEYERLTALGVVFRGEPANAGGATVAVLEDTCGNLIQLYQVESPEA